MHSRQIVDGHLVRELAVWGIRHLPRRIQYASPIWAALGWTLSPRRATAVIDNLERLLCVPRRAARRSAFRLYRNYIETVRDSYAVQLGLEPPIDPGPSGRDRLARARAVGRGVILVSGHLGAWALGTVAMQHYGIGAPLVAMAEERDQRLHAAEEQRRGWQSVYTTRSPFAALELCHELRKGGMVAMQLDRDTGDRAIELPFCGHPARFPLGPAILSRLTGAPILPVFLLHEGRGRFSVCVEEHLIADRTRHRDEDLLHTTERLVAIYESYVRAHPLQWFNFHPFWPTEESPL